MVGENYPPDYFRAFFRDSGRWMRLLVRLALIGVDQAWVLTEAHRSIFGGLMPSTRVRCATRASWKVSISCVTTPA
jgi:hypothetical protein